MIDALALFALMAFIVVVAYLIALDPPDGKYREDGTWMP